MVINFEFNVDQNVQLLYEAPENVFIQVKAEDGVFIGDKEVTVENGLPFISGYHRFFIKKGDAIYVIGRYPSTKIRVLITSALDV